MCCGKWKDEKDMRTFVVVSAQYSSQSLQHLNVLLCNCMPSLVHANGKADPDITPDSSD